MKWLTKSKLGKAVLVLGVLLVVVGILTAVIHANSKSAVEEYRDKLRAAGEKLTVEELLPPRVPPERNGTAIFNEAAAFSRAASIFYNHTNLPQAMAFASPGKAIVEWRGPFVLDLHGTNRWVEAESVVAERAVVLSLLQKLIERPVLDFEVNPQDVFTSVMTNLSTVREFSALAPTAVVYDLHRGDTASAFTNSRVTLALVKALADHRLVVPQLVRYMAADAAFGATWTLLQSSGVNAEQLATLQGDWEEQEYLRTLERSQELERVGAQIYIANMRTSNSPMSTASMLASLMSSGSPPPPPSSGWFDRIQELSKSAWDGTKHKTAETLWRVSWSYTDELRALQGEQVLIETIRQVQTNGYFSDALMEQDRKLKVLGFGATNRGLESLWAAIDDSGLRNMFSESVNTLNFIVHRLERAQTQRQLVITAIALRRYELRHGHLPESLNVLAPEFVGIAPRDPVDGRPLRYRLNPDGSFVLYSIGENGKDDGGDPAVEGRPTSRIWNRGRDWVWPQPASPKEIEDYEKEVLSGKR